jgi:hypothetical protein
MPLQATSGAASYDAFGGGVAAVPTYIEEIFGTFLYTGNGSTQTITNGIDLAGKGGLVWIKNRVDVFRPILTDTVRGVNSQVFSDTDSSAAALTNIITAFNSTGFNLGSFAGSNTNANANVSWTFREQAKFFDVVTWTGTGSNTTIAHSLGAVPACIFVKRIDDFANWQVYHRSLANTQYMVLNSTAAVATGATRWNSTTPTDTVFSLGTDTTVNASGGTYVAYLFAHNAGGFGLTGTDNVISCGSYTGNGSADGPTINLGYEPQWLMVKCATSDGGADPAQWWIIDNMRGWESSTFGTLNYLAANSSQAELERSRIELTSTGFKLRAQFVPWNGNGQTYIYIAIRRGPMKVPTTGTSVFAPVRYTTSPEGFITGFPVDFGIAGNAAGTDKWYWQSRLQGAVLLSSATNAAEVGTGSAKFDMMNGYGTSFTSAYYTDAFRRAPGFMDVVCYTGTGSNTTQAHNLAAVPELMLVKSRSNTRNWICYSADLGNTKEIVLNSSGVAGTNASAWNNTSPTSSVFTVGTDLSTNGSGYTFVAYLFATCPGVSKVTNFTGNGSSQTINCGFTSGARFVMIKATSTTGNWTVFDSARGISAGGDPALYLNSTAAEVTGIDAIDADSTGFIVNQEGTFNLNASGVQYLVLAIS